VAAHSIGLTEGIGIIKLENATLLTEVKWMQVQWMEIILNHQEEMQK